MMQLSYSAAQRYVSSPLSYFLHYFLRLRPVELSSPLIFGGAIDVGLNHLLNAVKNGEQPSVFLAQIAFVEAFKKNGDIDCQIKGNVKFSKSDLDYDLLNESHISEGHDPAWHSLSVKGMMIIEAYAEQVLPRLEKVILVQHEIDLKNDMGDSLVGFVDLVAQIDGKVYILDNKTSSIKYAEDAANESQQLGTYFEALKDEYKLDGVGFIVIPKNIRKKKLPLVPIEIKLGKVSDEIMNETFAMYEEVLNGIKLGKFECSRACTKTPWGCVYKKYCDSHGTDTSGLHIVKK